MPPRRYFAESGTDDVRIVDVSFYDAQPLVAFLRSHEYDAQGGWSPGDRYVVRLPRGTDVRRVNRLLAGYESLADERGGHDVVDGDWE